MAFDPNDAETKAAVAKAVKEAVEAEVAGLQAKNKELLDKLKKAQAGAVIDPAEHAALQAELSEAQTKLAEANKALKAAVSDADKSKKALEGETSFSRKLIIDNALSKALLESGVKKPSYLKAAIAILSGQVKVENSGDDRVAKIGEKTLADAVKEWAGTDEGKAFVDAPANRGGGANGGAGGGDGKDFSSIKDPAARLAAISEAEAAKGKGA